MRGPGFHHHDLDVGSLRTRHRRSHRRRRVPHVADDVAARARRGPARKDDVDLRRLIVAPDVSHVSPARQLGDLPRPGQRGKLVEAHHHVAVQRERGARAAQAKGQRTLAAHQLHLGAPGELPQLPSRWDALDRHPRRRIVGHGDPQALGVGNEHLPPRGDHRRLRTSGHAAHEVAGLEAGRGNGAAEKPETQSRARQEGEPQDDDQERAHGQHGPRDPRGPQPRQGGEPRASEALHAASRARCARASRPPCGTTRGSASRRTRRPAGAR